MGCLDDIMMVWEGVFEGIKAIIKGVPLHVNGFSTYINGYENNKRESVGFWCKAKNQVSRKIKVMKHGSTG